MQITDIMKKSAELREEVKDYQSDRLQRAEEYIADLMAKAESLERIQTEIKISLQENSSTSIIAERQSIQCAEHQYNNSFPLLRTDSFRNWR